MSAAPRLRRLLRLIEHLQSGRTRNATELANLCGVSRRTIFRDLKLLLDAGLPVLYDPRQQGHWMVPAVDLPNANLSFAETLSLLVLSQAASAAGGATPWLHQARNGCAKLLGHLPPPLRSECVELSSQISVAPEGWISSESLTKSIDLLMSALRLRVKARLTFSEPLSGSDQSTLLAPYHLRLVRHDWFVIGRSSVHRDVRTFPVRGIQAIEVTTDPYRMPPRFSVQRYLGRAWSIRPQRGGRVKVVVRFDRLIADEVGAVTWHQSQQPRRLTDGGLELRFVVDGVQEIAWWVLSFGDLAEVLEPFELRQLLVDRIGDMSCGWPRLAALSLPGRR